MTSRSQAGREDERDAALERLFSTLIVSDAAALLDAKGFRQLMSEAGVFPEDQESLVEQGPEKLLVYRRLIHGAVHNAIATVAPLTSAHLAERLPGFVGRFLAERGPQSRYLRDVVQAFVEYCTPLWTHDETLPPFLTDIARYEVLQVEIGSARDRATEPQDVPLTVESSLCFIDACGLGHYHFRVHEIATSDTDQLPQPAHGETHVFVYRDATNTLRCLALSPLAHALLERLLRGEALGAALQAACTDVKQPLTQTVLDGTASVLSDIAARGALIGAKSLG